MDHRIELSETDLIEAILAAQDVPGDGALTARELMSKTGMTHKRLMDRLRQLADAGRLEVHYVPRRSVDGRSQRLPGYRLRSVNETS